MYPELTVKVAGKVCLCVDALEKMIDDGLRKQRKRAEKLEAIQEELKDKRFDCKYRIYRQFRCFQMG